MSKQVLSIQFKKKGNKIKPASKLMTEQFRLFVKGLPENATVECIMELKTRDNTKAQLAKIHVCIKEIADEQGDNAASVKKEVKRQCGMTYKDEKGKVQYESFSGCSKEDLSNVIETIIQMGNFLNVNFRETLQE